MLNSITKKKHMENMQFYSKRVEIIFSFACHSEIAFCNSLQRQMSHVTIRENNEGKCLELYNCDPIQFSLHPGSGTSSSSTTKKLFMDSFNSAELLIISANFNLLGC